MASNDYSRARSQGEVTHMDPDPYPWLRETIQQRIGWALRDWFVDYDAPTARRHSELRDALPARIERLGEAMWEQGRQHFTADAPRADDWDAGVEALKTPASDEPGNQETR